VSSYDFARQFGHGKDGEHLLDSYFSQFFTVTQASRDDERRGIDRYFANEAGKRISVEYKTDYTAGRTGNLFIETISVDRPGECKTGWMFTCSATWLVIYVPAWREALAIRPPKLREQLPLWMKQHIIRAMAVSNDRYFTHGVLIPRAIMASLASHIYDLRGAERLL